MFRAACSLTYLCLCASSYAQVLERNAEVGSKHSYEISQFTTEVRSSGGKEDNKTEYESLFVVSVEAGPRDAEGRTAHKIRFESLRYRQSYFSQGGNGELIFDSLAKVAKSDSRNWDFFLDALRPLVGASYTVVVGDDHHVVAVDGPEEILNQATPRAAEWLKGLAGPLAVERLKLTHERGLVRFSKNPIKQGDVWEAVDNVDCFFSGLLKVERRFECLGTEERGGRLVEKIRTTDKGVVDSKIAWNVVESKGTIYFDRQRGLAMESTNLLKVRARVLEQDRTATIETSQRLKD